MDNFKNWLLSEMPITKFQLMGQWGDKAKRNYGYNRQDIGILQNQNAVNKIHRHWSNTHYDFEFYFLRSQQAYKRREIGEVSPEWVKTNLGVDIQPNEDAINIIFTNNIGAEKIPMTAWMIAHRLGHAVRRDTNFEHYFTKEIYKDFRQLLKEIYGIKGDYYSMGNDEEELRALAYAVGTMNSAEKRKLFRFNEFIYELVAQYIITGKIKFNPIPRSLVLQKRMAWGNPADKTAGSRLNSEDHEYWNHQLESMADKYEHYLDSIFGGLVGHLYVM